MSSLILVRHCEAAGQEPDAPLTDAGHRQAGQLATFLSALPVDAIVASGYLRARQTAEAVADLLHLGIEVDHRLNERILSPFPIDNWQQVLRDSFSDPELSATGGESANEVLTRAWSALNERLRGPRELPVVVTHGNLLALVLHSIDSGFGYASWENLSNPDVYRVDGGGDGVMSFQRLWNPSILF